MSREPLCGALFAGYGGLDLAIEDVYGARLAWYCEIDPGAALILAFRFPGVPNYGDVTKVKWTPDCPSCGDETVVHWDPEGEPWYWCARCVLTWETSIRFDDPDADRIPEPVEIVSGGSPCQDLSGAGRRAGMTEGTRSNLWVQMRESIARLQPARVVWENVRGAFSAEADSAVEHCSGCMGDPGDRGPALFALGRVLGDLSDLRYDAGWHGLLAADPEVGGCHPRFRVFVSALRSDLAHAAYEQRQGDESPRDGRPGPADGDLGPGPVRLIPTPTTRDHKGHNQRRDATCLTGALLPTPMTDPDSHNGHGRNLGAEARAMGPLLPTPRASDGDKGGPNQRGSSGDLMLPSAVMLFPTPTKANANGNDHRGDGSLLLPGVVALLPTPAVNDMGEGKTPERWDEWTADMKSKHGNGNGHGKSLAIEAQRLLPTATAMDSQASGGGYSQDNRTLTDATVRQPSRWGDYAEAIARWESVLGRPAPDPVQWSTAYRARRRKRLAGLDRRPVGMRGSLRPEHQLAPVFVEWMMGLPAGWVTDPAIWAGMTDKRGRLLEGDRLASASRIAQLKALGNGVVHQQAAHALRRIESWWQVAA